MTVRITAGSHRGIRLRSARDPNLRPTSARVREAIFSILGDMVEGARVLDLYAGTGVIGIEALSRGAVWVDFVETNAKRAQRIRENLRELSLSEFGKVYRAKVERALDAVPGRYTLVFADPPYDMNDWDDMMNRLGREGLLEESISVTVEHRFGTGPSDRYGALVRSDLRRYGDTAISIYRMWAPNG